MDRRELLTRAVGDFVEQRTRVTSLAVTFTRAQFEAAATDLVVEALTGRGHFDIYDSEVAWSPRLVLGHLGDSARIFAERIARVRAEDAPWLADFVTDEHPRLARYRRLTRRELIEDLEVAHDLLERSLRDVQVDDLDKTATHEVDGVLTLRDIVTFLPGHQRDHAEQLELLG